MLNKNTVTKLPEMRLGAMTQAFKVQMSDPDKAELSFEDRFGLLVDHEWTTRKNNHLNWLIKTATFAEPNACVEDIEYHADRNLDKAQIARLASCDYTTEHRNVMFLGATGSGKTCARYVGWFDCWNFSQNSQLRETTAPAVRSLGVTKSRIGWFWMSGCCIYWRKPMQGLCLRLRK